MKTKIIDNDVAIVAAKSAEFTIKANGKAFRALISTLYENKEQSVVREIWSNALDSHMSSGMEERPFQVTFPTVYNPTFVVRDFGDSLNHDQVMHLYSTVFESTKEDSEDEAGKFGLGSKSPFAYTDTFSVVAIQDGIKRHYSAVIGKKGIPAIHFLGQEETDEEQGLEVSFPIKSEDINKFRKAAQRVSHGFSVKPEVLRVEEEDVFEGWPELDVVLEGVDWKILRGNIEGYSSQAYAKMGPVLYPINVNAIDDLPLEARQLLQTTIVIEFPMGSLEMTPSREALSYGSDEPTSETIRSRSIEIVNEMIRTYQERYARATSYWNACVQYVEDTGTSTPQPVKTALEKTAHWKGKALKKIIKIDTYLLGADTTMCLIPKDKRKLKTVRFHDRNSTIEVIPSKDTIIYVEDTDNDKRSGARIRMHYGDINPTPTNIIWVKARTKYLRQKVAPRTDLMEVFDGAEMILVSDLEMPESTSWGRRVGGGIKRPVSVRTTNYSGDFDVKLQMSPEDYEAGGYYVPLMRMEPQYPSSCRRPDQVFEALQKHGAVPRDAVLYGAPKTLWKLFDGPQWINIYDHGKRQIEKSKPKAAFAKARMINEVLCDPLLSFVQDNIKLEAISKGPAFEAVKFREKVAGFKAPDVSGYKALARALGKDAMINEWMEYDDTEVGYHKLELEQHYPLIRTLRTYCRGDSGLIDKVTHYVQVCDIAASADSQTTAAAA